MSGRIAGAVGIALFVAQALIVPAQPDFGTDGAEIARWYGDERTRIQIGCLMLAFAAAALVWFLATVAALAREAGPGAGRTAAAGAACGLVFVALFLADVTTLAVGALRPENMAANPELAAALRDFEFMAMGMAAPVAAAMLAAFALVALRERALWPRWIGWIAAVAAPLYLLRAGTLFTTDGPFAADGLLGIYVPVAALAAWTLLASVVLARR